MSLRGCSAILVALAAGYALGAQGRNEPKKERSPHAEALELVLRTQQERIREAERNAPHAKPLQARLNKGDEPWWFDTEERTWLVKRPFGPGVIDSTHMFNVYYRIAGKEAASWLVDTRAGDVQSATLPAKKQK